MHLRLGGLFQQDLLRELQFVLFHQRRQLWQIRSVRVRAVSSQKNMIFFGD